MPSKGEENEFCFVSQPIRIAGMRAFCMPWYIVTHKMH